ncbi:MAG: hypothetical protein KGL39_24405 [Patescibacteria group bacterium]|nr:hypothetical protein [Patescibacteria group bacterium]
MRYFKDITGKVFGFDDNQIDFVNKAINERLTEVTGSWPPAPLTALQQEAQAQLAAIEAPGGLISRCLVRGVAVPATYTAYALALVAIINGTDKTSTALPTVPAYVKGT